MSTSEPRAQPGGMPIGQAPEAECRVSPIQIMWPGGSPKRNVNVCHPIFMVSYYWEDNVGPLFHT